MRGADAVHVQRREEVTVTVVGILHNYGQQNWDLNNCMIATEVDKLQYDTFYEIKPQFIRNRRMHSLKLPLTNALFFASQITSDIIPYQKYLH